MAGGSRGRIADRLIGGVPYVLQPMAGRRPASRQAAHPRALSHAKLGDVVSRYQAALDAGDTDAIVSTFAREGYYREPVGPYASHRGAAELRSFFIQRFSAGGGIRLQTCAVTDDGVRCALEYNCVRWGRHVLAPQAGIGVYERGSDGLLAAPASTTTSSLPPASPERRSRSSYQHRSRAGPGGGGEEPPGTGRLGQ
jgi:SnoaL-like domain